MGCGTSAILDSPQTDSLSVARGRMKNKNSVDEFIHLDEEISEMEGLCPGPRLATAEAWIEHLQEKRDALVLNTDLTQYNSAKDQTVTDSTVVTVNQEFINDSPSKDLTRLVINLGVLTDKHKASAQEDFFANINKSALEVVSMRYYNEILDHTKSRVKLLTENYRTLNELYVQQDGIIALISGGTYMTSFEESLDSQLETARDVRDKLGSTLEQWRICGLLLRACSKSASQGLQFWKSIKALRSPKDVIHLVLECRNNTQASLIALECAQLSLPNVEIKFVSNRQVLAVKHINTYMITDIADELRYNHVTKVLETYEENMQNASSWLYETYNSTLRKDFDKAESTVKTLSGKLRSHRHELFIKETERK
ncbi:uncharacterized protein LOC129905828 [Episyrphus balteatus]|uniref:uncharacterized protein LOC129905828 n=1 Tax=Episyrphus balteatus TaxID=286459 RepID=UPI00248627D8|nr:uncharacterized protein LOC129905828 [Episyrphus balteatus]